MKIFVFGANGMLGSYVSKYLAERYEVIAICRKDYDLCDLNVHTLYRFLMEKNLEKDDIVINCAGVIPQASKQRDLNTRLYFLINSIFPVILSSICSQLEVKMIHITTDCVFSGKDGQYHEMSQHDEINDYGLSKSLGEKCDCTIIRTSIIGEEIYNKISLLEWVKSNSGKEIKGYINHYWNGVTCLQLSKIILEIIEKELYWQGVKHIFSPNSVTKYDLVSLISDIYGLNVKVNPFSTPEKVDKTITSIYPVLFDIPDLKNQILEMKEFDISKHKIILR